MPSADRAAGLQCSKAASCGTVRGVIVRVLTARVAAPAVASLNQLLRAQLAELHEQPGLVYAKLARRLLEDDGEEIVLFEEWRTPADLWTWTRGRLATPRLLPATEELISELRIDHYESLDVLPDDVEFRRAHAEAAPDPAAPAEASTG